VYPDERDFDDEHAVDDFDLEEDGGGEDGEDETLDCPSCGRAVYEDTDRCPHCGDWIMPLAAAGRPVWMRMVAAIVVIGLLFGVIAFLSRLVF
jgi:hypothetical protein